MTAIEITMLALCESGDAAQRAVRRLAALGIGADRIGAVVNRSESGGSNLSVLDGGTLLPSLGEGDAADGALVRTLVGLGVPEPDARASLDELRDGGALVIARVSRDEADRVQDILDEAAGGAPPWRDERGGADVARGYAVAPQDTAEAGGAGLRPRSQDPVAGQGADTGPRVHRNLTATGTAAPADTGGRSGADTGAGSHPLAGRATADVDPATGGLGLTGEAGSASPSRSRVRVAVYGGHTEPILASQYAGEKPRG